MTGFLIKDVFHLIADFFNDLDLETYRFTCKKWQERIQCLLHWHSVPIATTRKLKLSHFMSDFKLPGNLSQLYLPDDMEYKTSCPLNLTYLHHLVWLRIPWDFSGSLMGPKHPDFRLVVGLDVLTHTFFPPISSARIHEVRQKKSHNECALVSKL